MWTNRQTAIAVLFLLRLDLGTAGAAAPNCIAEPGCNDLLKRGKAAHNQKDYAAALAAYETAYDKVPDPILLVLKGRTQFKKGSPQSALELYLRAEQALTCEPDRQRLAQYIAEAREALVTRAPPLEPTARSGATEAELSARAEGLTPELLTATQRPEHVRTPIYKRWWFWTAVSVAAAGVATSVSIAVAAHEPDTSGLDKFYPYRM